MPRLLIVWNDQAKQGDYAQAQGKELPLFNSLSLVDAALLHCRVRFDMAVTCDQ